MSYSSVLKRNVAALAVLGALVAANPAKATIVVDGIYDSAYGSPTATVAYDPSAPNSNFGDPRSASAYIGYQIWLKAQNGNVYGFLQASGPGSSVAPFANLYWDLNPAAADGSDLGFELSSGAQNAFVPGVTGSVQPGNIMVVSLNSNSLEFAIPNIDFMAAMAGLNYYAGQTFPGIGDKIVLRLSQSFGYSVAGGPDFGDNRLGAVELAAAAPEASTWVMMLLGFGFLGLLTYRRARSAKVAIA